MKGNYFFLLLIISGTVYCQQIEIQGVIVNKDAEGIHVINKTANLYTITDKNGVFLIKAKQGDVLVFSSIQYNLKVIRVDENLFNKRSIEVVLDENLNELDEVIVGMQLTGDLKKDLSGIETEKPFDFNDAGVPGYSGVQKEKIVPMHRAVKFYGLGFSADVEAIYKNLSGYYKTLKTTRKWDKENNDILNIANFYGREFLSTTYDLPKEKLYAFLLMCMDTSEIQYEFAKKNHNNVLKIFKEKRKFFLKDNK